ncbi:MAG: FadR/GntR family transcriptional regulator [Janthinobacterium lividum]
METLHRQVLNQIGTAICAGQIQPGEFLPTEPMLAEQYNVSRITIREMTKSLAAKGMLQVRRRYGTMVTPRSEWQLFDPDVIAWRVRAGAVDTQLLQDVIELRLIIEPAAAKLAARRASPADHSVLRAAYTAMDRAVADRGDYVVADLAFHGAILAACRNPFIQQVSNALSAILRASFALSPEIPGGPARTLPLHDALCTAIEKRQPEAAEAAMLILVHRAEDDLRRAVRQDNHKTQ